ncbi:MAG: hypothetical protein RLZZ126_1083 [Pseudomonadota bacterium]
MRQHLVTALLAMSFSFAHAAPPTVASVEALLDVTKTEATMDAVFTGLEPVMRQMLQRIPNHQSLTSEQQRAVDAMPAKVVVLLREEFSFAKLKPQFVELYQEVFEQEEVDAQLAFYRTPAGQAMINKMPRVMQKTVALSQAQVQRMMPRMQQIIQQMVREAQAGQ